MKQFSIFLAAVVLAFIVVSCSKSNEEDVNNNNNNNNGGSCDTTNMQFTANIKPILQSNCYSCHSNANAASSGENNRLEDYEDVKHHADHGDLLGTITHANGYPAMPRGLPKLSDCNINKIRAWVNAGAPNN